jgi:hypothetical protein
MPTLEPHLSTTAWFLPRWGMMSSNHHNSHRSRVTPVITSLQVHIAGRWRESIVSEPDGLVCAVDDGPPLAHDGRLRYNRQAIRLYVVGRPVGE